MNLEFTTNIHTSSFNMLMYTVILFRFSFEEAGCDRYQVYLRRMVRWGGPPACKRSAEQTRTHTVQKLHIFLISLYQAPNSI